MTTKKDKMTSETDDPTIPESGDENVVRMVIGAPAWRPPEASGDDDQDMPDPFDAQGPSDLRAGNESDGANPIDGDVVKRCAPLDHSDTDNGHRLINHFGSDLVVMAQGATHSGDWLCWDGRHWDMENGLAGAMLLAQKVGGRIALEAEYLNYTPQEYEAINAVKNYAKDDESDAAKKAQSAAREAKKALKSRKLARWRFAITSKNLARLRNMQECASSHLRHPVETFNSDPFLVVTQTHTLRLVTNEKKEATLIAIPGHNRDDYVTGLIPCDYDPNAISEKWTAFLDRCLPEKDVRRTVQQYAGTGLLGHLLQRLMFHHGFGANGKSVFLAVLAGVIGKSYGVSLPKETIMGQGERGAGQASPDLVRLFGKRMVRIDELKENESVREDLIKRLTGGDVMPVRNLFKGYFEFTNFATPHMSGNGFPKIDGTDNGIWRRMLVVHWETTIPVEERREFDEFVADLLTEKSGILNWLLYGALDYLANGLFIAPKIAEATQEYREDMDPIGRFVVECIRPAEGESVKARTLYEAYKTWAMANAVTPCFETRFGREMGKRFKKCIAGGGVRTYADIELHDVPDRPDEKQKYKNDSDDNYTPPEDDGF